MRKRAAITLAAGGRWPDAGSGGFGFPFNWVKVDNRGGGGVDVALSGTPAAGDKIDTLLTVGPGRCRVFNVAGPRTDDGPQEDWPDEIRLVSALGTSAVLEVADHPIVDLSGTNDEFPGGVVPSSNYGTATTPTAGQTIVGVGQVGTGANFPPGLYKLTAAGWYGGTADVADNMKLVAATVATIAQLRVFPVTNGTPVPRTVLYYLPTAAVFHVEAVANSGAGGVFVATLDVQPVGVDFE